MGSYVTNTPREQEDMLKDIGCDSFDDLYRDVPAQVRIEGPLQLPKGCSELSVFRLMEETAEKNRRFPHLFRGAGAYRHYIPAIVDSVTSKEEFVTAYTPYQAEISQGNLQSIFEYQTMICELTGMEVSNASVYDGACAAAEGVLMCRERKRTVILVSAAANPQVRETIATYCWGKNARMEVVPEKDGVTDREALEAMLGEDTACLYMERPNYYGILEDTEGIGRQVHEKGAKFVMGCNPISLGNLTTPADCGADVAVGEGQPLGIPLGFGGPYLGYMAATGEMMRKLPGRIVGETVDTEGKRGFVLTLQAREQHIRRERASSNICSNQALCAMRASVYLAAMGPEGLQRTAVICAANAHYLQRRLAEVGLSPVYDKEFFHEFVTSCPIDESLLMSALAKRGYLGGLPIGDGRLLWCATEMNTKREMDELADLVKEVCAR